MSVSTPKPKHSQVQKHIHSHSIRAQAQASPSSIPAKPSPSSAPSSSTSADGASAVKGQGKGKAKAELKGNDKVVYKTLIEGPNKIKWPNTPSHLQQSVLSLLGELLLASGLSEYHLARGRLSQAAKKRKRRKGEAELRVIDDGDERGAGGDDAKDGAEGSSSAAGAAESSKVAQKEISPPDIEQHLIIGLNEITKSLESLISTTLANGPFTSPTAAASTSSSSTPSPPSTSQAKPRIILVCRSDLNPAALVDHFPPMVAALNGVEKVFSGSVDEGGCYLVQLPKGAEYKLAEWTGLRRCSALMILDSLPTLSTLVTHLSTSTVSSSLIPRAKWLEPILPSHFSKPTPPTNTKSSRSSVLPKFIPTQPGLISTQPPPHPPQAKKAERELLPMRVKLLKTTKKAPVPKDQQAKGKGADAGSTGAKRKTEGGDGGKGKKVKVGEEVKKTVSVDEEEDEMNGMNG